jgi:hypothetical protein
MSTDSGVRTRVGFDKLDLSRKKARYDHKKSGNIEKGIYIKGKLETFALYDFFDERMGIKIPDSFAMMPEKYKKIKYPSELRPQEIITNVDLSVNMGFTYYEQEASESELPQIIHHTKSMLTRTNIATEFLGEKEVNTTNCPKYYFEFRSQAVDGPIYNMHFLTLIDGRIMYGMFNCMYKSINDWSDVARQMVESIVDLTLEEED